jgi:catechol 2,3-dioxygenase-like lactoylglutathione lyase family enzyme
VQRGIWFCLVTIFLVAFSHKIPAQAQSNPRRPRILGIAQVGIYVSDTRKAHSFYEYFPDHDPHPKHARRCFSCERSPEFSESISLNRFQGILLHHLPSPPPENLIVDVGFWTDNVTALRDYLAANKIEAWTPGGPKVVYLSLKDPEGHRIYFLETQGVLRDPKAQATLSGAGYEHAIIHAGFVVKDREAEDKFYKDILGFHVYWHGGMKEGEDNWVDMQVPDGTDWIEYMLKVPENATHKQLGVMNHIALGVPDIYAAQQQLIKNGWKGTEEPKIGRDGKWQLNLYDPDETRVELMEFKPTKEPCCSPYTGPHPGPSP